MRKFEKISQYQWDIDTNCDFLYSKILYPKRGTKKSAGYDFFSPVELIIPAHEMAKVPTGIKVCMNDDEILSIYPRSSIGFKTGIRLANTVGIVDAKKKEYIYG